MESWPGVKAVATGEDLGGRRFGRMPATTDEPPLALDSVRDMSETAAGVTATVQLRFGRDVRTSPVLQRLHPLSPFHEYIVGQGHWRVTNMVGVKLILDL